MAMFDGHVRRLCSVPNESIDAVNGRLKEQLESCSDYWEQNDAAKPNKDLVFAGNTQHIVFGFPVTPLSVKQARRYPAWLDWSDVIQPLIDLVTPLYGYREGRVNRIMLARLRAGAQIPKHIDADPSARLPHKIHVPLTTNPRVELWEENAKYHLAVGGAYEVNNRIAHGGANFGDEDRVHLIFDYLDVALLAEED
jgi:hypothetical protein